MCPDHTSQNTPSDGESVSPATDEVKFAFSDNPENFRPKEVKIKCGPCERPTLNFYVLAQPVPIEGINADNALENAKLIRRVLLCSICGNLRLVS